jgi:hypothetical protein
VTICLEIVRADGRVQRQHLHGERTTVGSSEQASICVPDAPELEPLHILVVPREQGVWLSSARNARTPALLDGKPFESGQLGLGAEIDVGSITFRVTTADGGGGKGRLRAVVLAITVVAVILPLAAGHRSGAPPRPSAPAPRLFSEQAAECPASGESAERRGLRAAERARSKKLRYPFDAREGLSAVELYRVAAACLAGTPEGAAVAGEEQRLRQRIEDDYQIDRLHLERALSEGDWAGALEATRQLDSLLANRAGEYRDWLARVARFVDLRLSEKKKDGPDRKEPLR